jgi:hypothetical protein
MPLDAQLPDGDRTHENGCDFLNAPPLTPEEALIEAAWLVQGVSLTPDDYAENQRIYAESDQHYQRVAYEAARSPDQWMLNYEITNGKILKIGISVGLGLFSGGSFNLLGGAIALAGSLFGSGKRKNGKDTQKKEEERFNQAYGIDSGGQLAIQGAPVPMAFGNRYLSVDAAGNAHGGVRVGGLLLHDSIFTLRGTQYLRQLWALSAGADGDTGHGHIKFIASEEILFDKQNRRNYSKTDIKTFSRPGTANQSSMPWFSEFSQTVSPKAYNLFGIDQRAVITASSTLSSVELQNGANVGFGNGEVYKTSPNDAWDAYLWSEYAIAIGGHMRVESGAAGATRAAGLTGYQGAMSWEDLDYGFYFTSSGYSLIENGQIISAAPSTNFGPSTQFWLEISSTGDRLRYLVNYVEIFSSSVRPANNLYANVLLKSPNSRFQNFITTAQSGGVGLVYQRQSKITASSEDFDQMSASDKYTLQGGRISRTATSFSVIQRIEISKEIIIDSVYALPVSSNVFAYWVGKYETTKHVSSITFNLSFNVFARNPENTAYAFFVVLFEVWVRAVGEPQSREVRLARLMVRSSKPVNQLRSIQFNNFPLGRYYFEFIPVSEYPLDEETLFELEDDGSVDVEQTLAYIGGQRISMRGELRNIAAPGYLNPVVNDQMQYNSNKSNISTRRGVSGTISTVVEQVSAESKGIPLATRPYAYSKLALLAIQYQASDRIQNSPGISTPIWECKSVPNLMAAGSSSGLSFSTLLNDPTSIFIGLQAGWILRNLDKKKESRIVSISTTTLTTSVGLDWEMGDRYLVYFLGASPYFPDTCAYVVTSTDGGAGDKINRDQDIDYESFVKARKFCVQKRFFWNGLVQAPAQPIVQWTEREAAGSLLIPGKINGRWALFPDELSPEAPQVFNTSNCRNASTEWIDWTESNINRLVVKYTDGRDLFEEDGARFRTKLVVIQTLGAYQGTDNPVEQTLDLPAVCSPLQAADVGVTAFNSAAQQTRTVSFDTSLQAVYLQGGKLIRFQHSLLDVGENLSSHAEEVEAIAGSIQKIKLAQPLTLYEGLASATSGNGATFESANLNAAAAIAGDLLVNVSKGTSAIITGKTNTSFVAAINCERGDLVQVINLTRPPTMRASITFRADGRSQDNLSVEFERRGLAVWLVIAGLTQAIAPLDPVILGNPPDSLYRVQRIQPSGKSLFRVSAVFHPGADLYSRAGLVVNYDDKDYFG